MMIFMNESDPESRQSPSLVSRFVIVSVFQVYGFPGLLEEDLVIHQRQ